MPDLQHTPVLLDAAIAALNVRPGGCYIDATFGRGGHTAMILQALQGEGHVYALDRDLDAVQAATERYQGNDLFSIQHGTFADLAEYAQDWGVCGKVDGILFDLGVSSPQIDEAARGFSFQSDGPLDMRMDQSTGETAAQWLAKATEREIADVIWEYGEERNARRIATAIIEQRADKPVQTTSELAAVVQAASRVYDRGKHPATRTFQAIRIYINNELTMLQQALVAALDVLVSAGRLVVISFHSLEDRVVKRFIRAQHCGQSMPRRLPVVSKAPIKTRLKSIGKLQRPTESEMRCNPRARSAVMRVAEKQG